MKLTLKQMQQEVERIEDRDVRPENIVPFRKRAIWHREGYDADYELELTGYQEVGAAADYFDIPNR